MGFLGIKWQTPVKSGLVGTSTPRNDRQETLIKQNSLEYSPEVTNTHSATATAWTRPRSVTSIMRMRSCGRNDDKLLQLPNNEQQKAQVQEDTTSSQSSGSCGQQRDLAIAFVPYVRTNRNESKSNHHEEQFKSRYVVTSDLANAWVQMASPDTKTDPKSTTTTKAVKITAATAATTAAPTTLRRSCIVAPKKRTVGGRRTRRQDPENRNDVQTTNSLARNGTGRSLLSSVGAFVLRLGGQCGSESVKGVLQSQHDGKKESTTASSTPSTDIIQDRHLNCLLATRSDHHRNKKTTTPEKSLDLSPSCLDLDSAALSSAQLQQHAASASTRGTATTATTSSTKTTRMPPESDSIEEITMLPNPSTTTKSAEIEITTAATSTAATTTTEKAKKDAPEGTKKSNKHDWKAAVDPKSGRTYYYHSLTRETQWSMPVEMASEEERAAMQEKEQKQKDFFAMMEANILKSISSGAFNNSNPDIINEVATDTTETDSTEAQSHPKEIVLTEALGRPPEPLPRPNNMVRTISTMDESVLKALIQHVPSYRNVLQTDDQEISFAPKPNEGMSSIGNGKNKGGHGKYGRNGGNKLLSIQEALENSWNQLDDSMSSMNHSMASMTMDGDDNNDKEKKINRRMGLSPKIQTSSMKRSVGSLLAGLPEDGDQNMNKNAEGGGDLYNGEMAMPTRRSFYGASLLDESCFELGFTEDEFKAMQGLAEMTDEIDNINDSDSSDDNDNNNTTKLNPLVEESDSNDYYNSNMNGSMGDFDFDLDDLDQDSESSSVHLESEQETGRDQAKTTATGLQRGASDGSLSFSVLDASSRGTDPAESRPTTSRGTTPRPVTVRPMSLRKVAPESSSPGMVKPEMQRRNTCNTLYVGSTMSEPDKDATIKCICGVFRAHILQAEMEEDRFDPARGHHRIFNDLESQQKRIAKKSYRPTVDFVVKSPPPLLDEITAFYRDVFGRAQMEADCIIMSLIYVERLIKCTNGALRPRTCNWRSILFSCMVLSSKVWDDLSMWNADFSAVCPTGVEFTLQRINELELAILSTLKYIVKVTASEYAKYYFLLRSMVIKSGLGGDDLKTMNPLDVQGAKRLQHMSSRYQLTAASMKGMKRGNAAQRSKSYSVGSSEKAKM